MGVDQPSRILLQTYHVGQRILHLAPNTGHLPNIVLDHPPQNPPILKTADILLPEKLGQMPSVQIVLLAHPTPDDISRSQIIIHLHVGPLIVGQIFVEVADHRFGDVADPLEPLAVGTQFNFPPADSERSDLIFETQVGDLVGLGFAMGRLRGDRVETL